MENCNKRKFLKELPGQLEISTLSNFIYMDQLQPIPSPELKFFETQVIVNWVVRSGYWIIVCNY